MRWMLLAGLSLAAGLLALGNGCAKDPLHPGRTAPLVGGEPVRARWWNFYERGRSLNDGGQYQEAEQSLRKAIAGRGRDQRWARTYGLHFIREYFPRRELGIALLYQEELDAALEQLTRSMDDEYSARAAYFLDRARELRVQRQGLDKEPPRLQIDSASIQPTVTGARRYVVRGIARDDTYVVRISVNGTPVDLRCSQRETAFSMPVDLAPGPNVVEVQAVDIAGRETRATVNIHVDMDGPVVAFDQPLRESSLITGTVFDKSGVASLEIDGFHVALEDATATTARFRHTLSEMGAERLKYRCADGLGNETRGVLAMDGGASRRVSRLGTPALAVQDALAASQMPNRVILCAGGAEARPPAWGTLPCLEVSFGNLREGQRFRLDEIVVTVIARSTNDIASVHLNDAPLQILPGHDFQSVARRMPLAPGRNSFNVRVEDTAGNVARTAVTVHRILSTIEKPSERLTLAMLGNVRAGIDASAAGAAGLVEAGLMRELQRLNRFKLVNRSMLERVLSEQELAAALGSEETRLAIGRIVPAEVFAVGKIRRGAESIEILLEAFSAETSVLLARAEVAGKGNTRGELEGLVRLLALRLVQEFPECTGSVLAQREGGITSDLGEMDLVRESTKLTVFRLGEALVDPETGEFLGRITEKLGEALVRSVRQKTSVAEVVDAPSEGNIQVGDHVATK